MTKPAATKNKSADRVKQSGSHQPQPTHRAAGSPRRGESTALVTDCRVTLCPYCGGPSHDTYLNAVICMIRS